ncbi:MAG: leucine-rich repeat protein [Clostridia bacterium]|nr:leucine-rich repeat protein [Clostridia bacterium]
MVTKTKRMIAILCTLCMLMGLVPLGAAGAEAESGTFTDGKNAEFTWSYDSETKVLTIGGTGTMTWSGNSHVAGLPWNDFKGEILDVKFEETLTSIGRQLLSGLTGLTELTIPAHITGLEWGALEGCTSLKSVVFESGVKTIGDKAFQECSALETVVLPETITHMGNAVFRKTAVTDVTIPASVTSLVPAFYYHTTNTFAEANENLIVKIYRGSYAASWVNNPDLDVNINYELIGDAADTVTDTLANRAGTENAITWTYDPNTLSLSLSGTGSMPDFTEGTESNNPWKAYRSQIRYAIVGEGITEIGSRNFESHTAMTAISLPSTLRRIYGYAFNSTPKISRVVLPKGFTTFKDSGIFNRVTGLRELVIPSSVTDIHSTALRYTPADLKLYVYGGSTAHTWAMSESNSCELTDGTKAAKTYEVLKDGGSVGDKITWEYDWENQTLIFTGEGDMPDANERDWHGYKAVAKKAIINPGITNVGKVCFKGFTALESVELPTTIKIIRDNAFNGCTSLTELEIPYGTHTFGLAIISGSGVKELTVPESVTCIYPNDVNQLHRHKSLTGTTEGFVLNVTKNSYAHTWALGTTTDKDTNETINNYEGILNIKEPGGKANDTITWAYDTETNTMTFTGTGDMPGWTTIDIDGDGAVNDEPTWYELRPWHNYVASAVKVEFSEGITLIGADTFRGGSSLKEITFPSTLKRIKQYAFANTGLSEITFNNGLEYIETGAFQQTNASELLEKAVIPNSVISMTNNTFKNQTALTIYCYGGSYAQTYAEENSIAHILMDSDFYITYSINDLKAVVTNYREEAVNALAVIANYTDGALTDVYSEYITLNPGKNEITAPELSQINGSVTKVMVMASTNLTPLCKALSTKITPTIRIAGDSISAPWPVTRYGQQGWGEPIKNLWTDDIRVINDAVSGWTTEKYYTEKWPGVKSELKAGDYLLVSYLHNDYYVPIKDTTKVNYIDTYRDYLQKLIDETKAMDVQIVLVVPPNRGVQGNFHGDFSYVMPELAEKNNIPCIDVHAKTIEMLDADLEGTKKLLYMYKLVEQGIITQEQLLTHSNQGFRESGEDLTHLSTQGAEWVANYVADNLAVLIPELAEYRISE